VKNEKELESSELRLKFQEKVKQLEQQKKDALLNLRVIFVQEVKSKIK
jgi:hypothetical protein